MEFKNIILDIDGTLADTEYNSTITLDKAIQEVTGQKMSCEDLYKHFGIPANEFFEMFELPNGQEISRLWNKYYIESHEHDTLYPDALETIEKLYELGITLAIVTSRSNVELKKLEKYNLNKYFKRIVVSDDTIKHKPNSDPIDKVINDLNLDKKDCIYIGDTIYDSMASKNAGIKFGLATWGTRDKSIPADIYLEKIEDILKYAKK